MNDGKRLAKKAMIIGLDGISPVLLNKLIDEGIMPNIKKMIKKGTFAEALAPLPGLTHPNWVSIATGAFPSTHGVTCHTVHYPGEPLDVVHNAHTSDYCQAEFLWNAAERVNKHSIILKYLCSWPPTIKNGIQVGGHGNPDGLTGTGIKIANSNVVYAGPSRNEGIQLRPIINWKNLPPYIKKPLEDIFQLKLKEGGIVKFPFLVFKNSNTGRNCFALTKSKDFNSNFFEISKGQWSKWIELKLKIKGQNRKGYIRFKLLDISSNRRSFRLFHTGILQGNRFTYPQSIGPELIDQIGPFDEGISYPDADPIIKQEMMKYQADWIIKATNYLTGKYPWSLFFLQWWWTDLLGHEYLHLVDPTTFAYKKEKFKTAWNYLKKGFRLTDKMVGELIKRADDDTVIAIVSDHGMLCSIATVFINNVLRQAGLLACKYNSEGFIVVDWSKTKAFAQRSIYIYVNMKGRDPNGIVNPGKEYEKIREKIIQAMLTLKDPMTKRRPVALALRKEQSGILGIYDNEGIGDIVYAMAPGYATMFPFREDQVYSKNYRGFGRAKDDWRFTNEIFRRGTWSHHGAALPGITYGLSSEKAILLMSGPRIKENYILNKPVWITDLAPTVAHLLGIPNLQNADGKILYQILK